MAKLNQIVYDIREALKQYSDDSEISDRYIIYLYNNKRSKYLRRDLNDYSKSIDNSIQQTFCIGVEEVSVTECGVDLDCETILRTIKPLPKPLELHTKTAITKVKPISRVSLPFNFISKEKAYYLDGSRFPNSIYAFLDTDGYIYLYSKSMDYKLLECISITGIFEDPLSLEGFSTCSNSGVDDTPCFNKDESEYPLQPHYIDLIRKEIITDLMGEHQNKEDKINNSTDG